MASNPSSNNPVAQTDFGQRLLAVGMTVVLLVVPTGAAAWFAYHKRSQSSEHALQVNPQQLDVGKVWMQEDFSWRLPVTNTSRTPIQIEQLRPSCPTVSVEPQPLVIPPRQTAEFQLTWDLSAGTDQQQTGQGREFQIELLPVVTGALPWRSKWTLRGEVVEPFVLTPDRLDFGPNLFEGSTVAPQLIYVESLVPAEELMADGDRTVADAGVRSVAGSRRQFELQVQPHPELPVGEHDVTIYLTPRGVDAASLPEGMGEIPPFPFRTSITVHPSIRATPSNIVLGAVHVGEALNRTVALSSAGRDFEVTEIVSPEGVKVEPLDRSQPRVQAFEISLEVTEEGNQRQEIRFVVEENGWGQRQLQVPIVFYGLAATNP